MFESLKRIRRGLISFLEIIYNYYSLRKNKVSYKSFPKINGFIFIRNDGNLWLGENVIINSKLSANPVGGNRMAIITGKNAELQISDGVRMSNSVICCRQKIFIGKNVFIGGDSKIYDTDFHSIHLQERLQYPDLGIKSRPVKIEDGAFIGAGCIILKGVKIGRESVIGAGSVVIKDIPEFEVWRGNPARYVKGIKPIGNG